MSSIRLMDVIQKSHLPLREAEIEGGKMNKNEKLIPQFLHEWQMEMSVESEYLIFIDIPVNYMSLFCIYRKYKKAGFLKN